MKTVRRPPYPKWNPCYFPCSSLTPLPLSSRRPSVSFGGFGLTLGTFLMIYKFMPNTKTYWRYIWPGAVVGALLFELAKNLFILYLNRFSSFENVYGTLAPVIVLLLWAYVSSLILIMGAELSSEYGRLLEGVNRGVLLHPRDHSSEGEAA